MIFDLLTSHQGHQFDPRMKILLAFCFACQPCQFDMPHNHPKRPKVLPWGMTQATEGKSRLICFASSFYEYTHKVWYKNLEIDFIIETNNI